MKRAALSIALVMFAAACAGNSDAAPATTEATVETTPEPETTVATTVATTELPPETTPSTEPPPESSEAPPTTLTDEARLRLAEEAYIESWEAFHAAIQDPANEELRERNARVSTPETQELILETLDSLVDQGFAARPNPEVEASTRLISQALFLRDRTDRADVIVCAINSEAYFEIGTAPGGGDALVRDEVFAVRSRVVLDWIDERWVVSAGETLSVLSGETECDR